MENADGMSGFVPVGGGIYGSASSYDHIVPLYNRQDAQYILSACNSMDCSDSTTMSACNRNLE
jgi:hypothetical protein